MNANGKETFHNLNIKVEMHRLKIVQIVVCSHNDEEVESYYENLQLVSNGERVHFTLISEYSTPKIRKKVERERSKGHLEMSEQ